VQLLRPAFFCRIEFMDTQSKLTPMGGIVWSRKYPIYDAQVLHDAELCSARRRCQTAQMNWIWEKRTE
jgi:hypothetical protein